MPGSIPQPESVDVDGVSAMLYGTIAWAIAFAACLLLRPALVEADRGWWIWTCAAGAITGVIGLVVVRRRRAVYAAARH